MRRSAGRAASLARGHCAGAGSARLEAGEVGSARLQHGGALCLLRSAVPGLVGAVMRLVGRWDPGHGR